MMAELAARSPATDSAACRESGKEIEGPLEIEITAERSLDRSENPAENSAENPAEASETDRDRQTDPSNSERNDNGIVIGDGQGNSTVSVSGIGRETIENDDRRVSIDCRCTKEERPAGKVTVGQGLRASRAGPETNDGNERKRLGDDRRPADETANGRQFRCANSASRQNRHRPRCAMSDDGSGINQASEGQRNGRIGQDCRRNQEERSARHPTNSSPRPQEQRIINSPAKSASRTPIRSRRSSPYREGGSQMRSSNGVSSPANDRPTELHGSLSKKCGNCGSPHFPYGRYSYLREYSGYLECDLYAENKAPKADHQQDARLETPVASLLCRSRSLPRLSGHDSGVACSGNEHEHEPTPAHGQAHSSRQLVADLRQLLTLKQHYYPEGGWGWVILLVGLLVQILSHGTHGAVGVLLQQVEARFGPQLHLESGWLGAMSTGVALLVSPVTIAVCRRKSTRVTAVLGGLVTALGCLFTSFASQFHQLFFSYGTVVGIGVGMTRDCSTLMVAQYFKRRRELVEIFIVSGSGLGIAVMSAFIKGAISKIGWRLGLQAVTGVVFLTFILGTFYRSASLYHPQRRAILHLKNQKRKIKDKNKSDDRPPFFDFSTLKSKTVRILLVSTGISAFGINTPIFYLAHQAEEEGLGDTVVLLQTYLGLAWSLGCVAFGFLVVHRSVECRIARQYLTQAAVFVCGVCILALTAVQGNYHGYVMFTWIYGIFCGGYHYSLKMYTYERVRARNFARTWGFVQCSQAIPIAIGVPISGYINVGCGGKAGYYFSSTCVLVGSFTLFFIDLHRRSLSRHKHTKANGTKHLCVTDSCPQRRRLSFSQEPENDGTHVAAAGAAAAALVLGAELAPQPGQMIDALGAEKPELTCISEEGIADMDLPDNLLEDLDYIGDCITSCNKVENYLMLSEFENNLIAEMPIIMDRRGRRWSLARSKPSQAGQAHQQQTVEEDDKPKWRLANPPANSNSRMITVIDEASA